MSELNSVPAPLITVSQKRIFEKIDSLILQGAVFLGNFWVNHPKKGGYFKIELKYKGRVISYNSSRCHPRIFGPTS